MLDLVIATLRLYKLAFISVSMYWWLSAALLQFSIIFNFSNKEIEDVEKSLKIAMFCILFHVVEYKWAINNNVSVVFGVYGWWCALGRLLMSITWFACKAQKKHNWQWRLVHRNCSTTKTINAIEKNVFVFPYQCKRSTAYSFVFH